MAIFPYPAPTFGSSYLAAVLTGAVATVSGTATTLWNPTIPAGHGLTNGSRLIISTVWTCTNSANNKSPFIKYGTGATTCFGSASIINSIATLVKDCIIYIRAVTGTQVMLPVANTSTYVSSTAAMVTGSEDLTTSIPISITATCATNTETVQLEYAAVWLQIA